MQWTLVANTGGSHANELGQHNDEHTCIKIHGSYNYHDNLLKPIYVGVFPQTLPFCDSKQVFIVDVLLC